MGGIWLAPGVAVGGVAAGVVVPAGPAAPADMATTLSAKVKVIAAASGEWCVFMTKPHRGYGRPKHGIPLGLSGRCKSRPGAGALAKRAPTAVLEIQTAVITQHPPKRNPAHARVDQ
jgi:hypothetical protein